ncbi:VanZ family protein [Bacillus sp. JJ1566]|uniref:VanZ family protein n=1 Tax=Bacillus sp. JJ1566 TaxID=3122961 RepID=UPI002FFF2057
MVKILSWTVVILWMAAIFHFSHQPVTKSNNLSKGIATTIVEKVEKVSPDREFTISKVNHIVRKNAHFFVYLVLGLLVLNALKRSRVLGYRE